MTSLKSGHKNGIYKGRFAPSPSGPLHFGSLIAALASYLQAKANNGLWYVRIEDIDKPREQQGAVEEILTALHAFGMNWDIDPNTIASSDSKYQNCLVQSERTSRYQEVLSQMLDKKSVYPCHCSRKDIKQMGGTYNGHCRDLSLFTENAAIRAHVPASHSEFEDGIFGLVTAPKNMQEEDYIVKRRDGFFAYQLAVVVDDIDQGITEVVRGADILELTVRQMNMFTFLGHTPPTFLHIPLASTKSGFKLSKQNHAQAIDINNPKPELVKALDFLGLPIKKHDFSSTTIPEIIRWAVLNWDINNVPKKHEIIC